MHAMPHVRWYGRRAMAAAVLLLVVAAALVVVQWQQHHLVALSVQSDSMQPLFSKGDALVVAKAEPASIRAGDIVTYPDPDHPSVTISHRVARVDGYTGVMVTKGDANATDDKPASVLAVTGVVHYVVPKAGYAIDALRSWPGLVAFIYLPAALIVGQEVRQVIRSYTMPTYVLHR